MKKIFLFSLLIILTMVSVVGCGKKPNEKEKEKVVESEIVSFKYDYGSYNGGYYVYSISLKDDKVWFTAEGYNGVDLKIDKEIDKEYLNKLAKIIDDNEINKWDGFDKSDKDVLDGYSFGLTVEYKNGKKIKAAGYMKYPDNYSKVHEELKEFFQSIE